MKSAFFGFLGIIVLVFSACADQSVSVEYCGKTFTADSIWQFRNSTIEPFAGAYVPVGVNDDVYALLDSVAPLVYKIDGSYYVVRRYNDGFHSVYTRTPKLRFVGFESITNDSLSVFAVHQAIYIPDFHTLLFPNGKEVVLESSESLRDEDYCVGYWRRINNGEVVFTLSYYDSFAKCHGWIATTNRDSSVVVRHVVNGNPSIYGNGVVEFGDANGRFDTYVHNFVTGAVDTFPFSAILGTDFVSGGYLVGCRFRSQGGYNPERYLYNIDTRSVIDSGQVIASFGDSLFFVYPYNGAVGVRVYKNGTAGFVTLPVRMDVDVWYTERENASGTPHSVSSYDDYGVYGYDSEGNLCDISTGEIRPILRGSEVYEITHGQILGELYPRVLFSVKSPTGLREPLVHGWDGVQLFYVSPEKIDYVQDY